MKRAILSILAIAAVVAIALVFQRRSPAPAPATQAPPATSAEPGIAPEIAPGVADEAIGSELEPLVAAGEEEPAPPAREEIAVDPPPGETSIPPPAPDSAPVRGRLTDALTGEPLPYFDLQVRDAIGLPQKVTTDEEGRFATAAALSTGKLRFALLDSGTNPRSVPEVARERTVVDGAAPDVDLAFASGPTFHLSIVPHESVPATRLLVRLRVANLDAKTVLDPEFLRVGIGEGPLDEAPWVRFGPVPEKFDRAESIDVESQDGLWVGSAKVAAVRGDVRELVRVPLDPRGVLQGRVVEPAGSPVSGARVALDATSSSGRKFDRGASTLADGTFRFPLLPGGAGTLSIRSLRHLPRDADVNIVPGSFATQDFVLVPLPSAGGIRGAVESRTGSFDVPVDIVLSPVEPSETTGDRGRQRLTARTTWSTVEGRRIGSFAFADLPAGRYEIQVREKGWLRWEPSSAVVSPPSDETRFVVVDDVPNADFVFRVRDADDGAELEGVQVSLQPSGRGGGSPWSRPALGAAALARYPLDRPFRWRLDLEGYRTAAGDEKAFAMQEVQGNRVRRIAEVELRRGWGEVFRVLSKPKNRPIAGAVVRLDGRVAGTTGADGLVLVDAAVKPARVEIVFRDWTLAAPLDLRSAWNRREKRYVIAWLAPPPAR